MTSFEPADKIIEYYNVICLKNHLKCKLWKKNDNTDAYNCDQKIMKILEIYYDYYKNIFIPTRLRLDLLKLTENYDSLRSRLKKQIESTTEIADLRIIEMELVAFHNRLNTIFWELNSLIKKYEEEFENEKKHDSDNNNFSNFCKKFFTIG